MEDEGIIRFREFEVNPRRFQIARSGVLLSVEPRVCDLILYLIRHRDRLVEKDELLEKVWQQRLLSDSAVARAVSVARKLLSDPECIQSVYGRGYRWMTPVFVTPGAQQREIPTTNLTTTLVGRDRELDLARALIRRAVLGQGGVYLVSGEAGIGKTRLLGAARDIAHRCNMRIIFGRSRETEGTPPYWPWPRIVEMLFGDTERCPEAVRFVRSFEKRSAAPQDGSTLESRVLAWEAFAECVRDEVRETPTAIIVDDLHQADVGSAYLFEFVAERANEVPLFLAAAYRPIELEHDPAKSASVQRTVRRSSSVAIELRGLSVDDTGHLLQSQVGVAPAPELVRRTHELTGGNPFFLGLVVPLLGQGAWDAKDIVQRLPLTVRSSIQSQLTMLSPSCRSLLSVAAVIGHLVPSVLAAAVLDRTMGDLSNDLEEARAAGLVREGIGSGQTFAFVHDLVREVVYEGLPRLQQSELHLAVARALEAKEVVEGSDQLAEIAHHYAHAVASGGAERAVVYALRAAASALERFAYEAAREHLARAVALMEQFQIADARSLCTVIVDLGTAELNSGNEQAAWTAFSRAWDLARDLGDPEPLVRMALSLTSSIHTTRHDYDPRLVRLLEELLARTDRSEPRSRALLLSRLIFNIAWLPQSQARRAALAREAQELAQRVEDPKVHSSVAVASYLGLPNPGDLAERIRHSENALRLCQAAGDLEISQFAHLMCILSFSEAGRLDGVREHVRGCRDVIHRVRTRAAGALAIPFAQAGMVAHMEGRVEDLEEIVHETAGLAEKTGDPMPAAVAGIQRALLSLERGLPDVAAYEAGKWAEIMKLDIYDCFDAMTQVRAGRIEEARLIMSGYATTRFDLPQDWNWLCTMTFLAQACADLGEREWAAMLYDRLLPYEDRCATIGAACGFMGSVQRYLGLLAALTGREAIADAHFERANEIHARIGARLMLAHSLCDHALFLERSGGPEDRERAVERRRAATELSNALGAAYLQEKLATSCGRPPHP